MGWRAVRSQRCCKGEGTWRDDLLIEGWQHRATRAVHPARFADLPAYVAVHTARFVYVVNRDGCVCCTIDEYSLAVALREIVEGIKPELITIETTGLADPRPVIARLKMAEVGLDAVVTIVDAHNFLPMSTQHDTMADQVMVADFLVLNAVDLTDGTARRRVERRLRRLNPRALMLQSEFGQVDTDLLFGTCVRAYREGLAAAGSPSDRSPTTAHAHRQDEMRAFVYRPASAAPASLRGASASPACRLQATRSPAYYLTFSLSWTRFHGTFTQSVQPPFSSRSHEWPKASYSIQ